MKAEKIWLDGSFVPWDQAQVHVMTHALHYGTSVFEGIRAYETKDGGAAIFRLREHVDRLFNSATIFRMEIPFTKEEIFEVIKETVRVNNLKSCYIRPLAFWGGEKVGLNPKDVPVRVMVAALPFGAYLGEEGLWKGVRAKISSYTRNYINSTSTKAKIGGNYVNSVFASLEVSAEGYDEAILLDTNGFVAEGPGENIFWARESKVFTTPLPTVLEGITRSSVITLAGDLGYPVVEAYTTRDELYIADEVWFTGTAAELTPIREIDGITIGKGEAGPIVRAIQDKFYKIVAGEDPAYEHWLARV
ncbi:MAG TPA: branched-chain amino acid transaminase [Firmicutes bacterium]|nr:branched-chain amino acid transaminase [Bacillota bacterium]